MVGTLGWQELIIILATLPLLGAFIGLAVALVAGSAPDDGAIERFYPSAELRTASPRRRFAAYLLDAVLGAVTLWIGWYVWLAIVAPRGQTPAKQLLGMYIMRTDGTRAGGAYVWVREVLVKGLLFGFVAVFTLYVAWVLAALWCVWDRDRQCLWDKVAGTYVAHSALGYRPQTADEIRLAGGDMPARGGAPDSVRRGGAAEGLRDLKSLFDDGIITDEEYEARRRRLVDRL